MDNSTQNIFMNLMAQVNRISKHARQGSYKTRERYKAGVTRFIWYLAEVYRLQKIANIQPKHIYAYVEYMQRKGMAASTVKTDLAAIRYYYDQIPSASGFIPHNDLLNLEKRAFGGVDRTWNIKEYIDMVEQARSLRQDRIAYVMTLGRYGGLRIHEALRVDTAAAEMAIKTGRLHVKGKNGRQRDIPLRTEVRTVLEETLKNINRGDKLFVLAGEKTHLVIKLIQNFIVRHREKFAGPNRQSNMTFHGLRHTYAAEEYAARLSKGMSEYRARIEVSELLGHERDDVTRIYILSADHEKAVNLGEGDM